MDFVFEWPQNKNQHVYSSITFTEFPEFVYFYKFWRFSWLILEWKLEPREKFSELCSRTNKENIRIWTEFTENPKEICIFFKYWSYLRTGGIMGILWWFFMGRVKFTKIVKFLEEFMRIPWLFWRLLFSCIWKYFVILLTISTQFHHNFG